MNSFTTVGVCGAGTMGSGIAQVIAQAGFNTVLFDLNENVLKAAQEKIETGLEKLVEKNKLSPQEKTAVLTRIKFTNQIEDCLADLIIEAIIEQVEAKLTLFKQLAVVNSKETVIASNTSSLSISALAELAGLQSRFLGLHFFNPAPQMKLVEVVRTGFIKEDLIQQSVQFVQSLGKTAVVCLDAPGFIVNRIARPFYIEALRLLEEKKASFEDIDQLLEAQGFKMGPFKLMDLIGNDVNYAVSCSVHEQLNKPERLQPSPIQKEKVDTGALGRKAGKGYYIY